MATATDGIVTPQMYGPVTPDATAAVQAMVNDACANIKKMRIPMQGGAYVLSKPITVPKGPYFCMEGDGPPILSMFQLAHQTQNGFDFSLFNGRLTLKNVGVTGAAGANAGSAFWFGGATNTVSASLLDNLLTLGCYQAIAGSGLGNGSNVTNCSLTATYPINLGTFGDGSIYGCTLLPTGSGGGATFTGDPGGLRFHNNKINGGGFNYGLSIIVQQSDGDILVSGNSIEGFASYGMIVSSNGNFSNFIISGNEFSGQGCSVSFTQGANLLSAITVNGNVLKSGSTALNFNGGHGLTVYGNVANGAIHFDPSCTDVYQAGNITL